MLILIATINILTCTASESKIMIVYRIELLFPRSKENYNNAEKSPLVAA